MSSQRKVCLSAKELQIGYKIKRGGVKIVHDNLNAHLYSGDVTCLLGLNGAGKSTLLRTLCGFQPMLGGEVELMGRPLSTFSQSEISTTIGVVLTEKSNAGGISVYELVSLGRHPYTGFFGGLKPHDHTIVEEALAAVGIAHKARNFVSELSDGERQKVMIAKVLAQQSPIIVLDEPTAFLDVTSRIETMLLLRQLAREQQKAILLSTHDLEMAIQLSDALWLQQQGEPLYSGSPEELILDGRLSTFFNRKGITFDATLGRLVLPSSTRLVGVSPSGDAVTTFWVSNALQRWGYKPTTPSPEVPHILCQSATHIEVSYPTGERHTLASISELRELFA